MPPSSDAALALAGQLRSLTDTDLAELLDSREFRETGIRDFFDLADALLDADSIQLALGRLDRPTLALLAAGEAPPAAVRLALASADGVHAPVAARLADWPSEGLPGPQELKDDPAPAALAPVSQIDAKFTDHAASEHAFATTTAIAELLAELQHEPARELAKGGIALPDSKRLSAAMGVDLDRIPGLVEIADRAGLVASDNGRLMTTQASTEWTVDSSGERWSLLAAAWLERLPLDIRTILAQRAGATWGEGLDEFVGWLFPAGGDWMRDRVTVYTRDAQLLGITADHVPSTPGTALLRDGAAAAARAMTALFPPEVEQVYLQHDLTVVSPGPLAPRLDARLRGMADVESRALASSYRVSAASLYRAMALGETAQSMREFLSGISLTGIPQPLEYLLAEATSRYGLVRVGPTDDGRSYVRSTDDTLLRTLLVDHTLAPLGLVRTGTRLTSRFDRELVFWSLAEARYPVAAEDPDGTVVLLRRRRATRQSAQTPKNHAISLIEKLRVGSPAETEEAAGRAWLTRQLDVAIRGKLAVTVTVELPDGTTMDYQLEPASVAGGRLRARDRRADIERTLPLASIMAVAPAE